MLNNWKLPQLLKEQFFKKPTTTTRFYHIAWWIWFSKFSKSAPFYRLRSIGYTFETIPNLNISSNLRLKLKSPQGTSSGNRRSYSWKQPWLVWGRQRALPSTHQQAIIPSTMNVVIQSTITHKSTAPSTYHFIHQNSIVSTLIQFQSYTFLFHTNLLLIIFILASYILLTLTSIVVYFYTILNFLLMLLLVH